ncbi:uncharacterized protein K489DRAFT_136870 [Dissoconium aciculare CBS 342.82]|uniref:Uncharacterized protein n=1 Tax=Dissoconium aciculare CBS 342.82 TaxID=1314786 RepID=A0A6J3LQ55_9PEZI|nr:uncharacterized protein K489DRAFT_136870 [Dissoconium aciculare CBS 342.82]KAF1817990.1 hypothetical protein K489DRAFT_136870 [Dissoconium aciculare CBS 342.82]
MTQQNLTQRLVSLPPTIQKAAHRRPTGKYPRANNNKPGQGNLPLGAQVGPPLEMRITLTQSAPSSAAATNPPPLSLLAPTYSFHSLLQPDLERHVALQRICHRRKQPPPPSTPTTIGGLPYSPITRFHRHRYGAQHTLLRRSALPSLPDLPEDCAAPTSTRVGVREEGGCCSWRPVHRAKVVAGARASVRRERQLRGTRFSATSIGARHLHDSHGMVLAPI